MTSLSFIVNQLLHTADPLLFMYIRNLSNEDKFERLESYYLNNPFLTEEQVENGVSLFRKIQHTYWALKRFVYLWRLRRARCDVNQHDFHLNELSSLSPQHKIHLLHCNTVYEFRLTDLLNIFCKDLMHSQNLNPAPKWPCHPYTGLPFSHADIYTTYFKLRKMDVFIPYYLHLFIQWDLSLDTFKFELFPLLKDYAIKNYLLDSSDEVLLFDIVHMVKAIFDDERSIDIETMSPMRQHIIIQTLKPYLEKYLYGTLSCNRRKKNRYHRQAKKELQTFFKRNPAFGRRIVRARRNNRAIL